MTSESTFVIARDGVRLVASEMGAGVPVVLLHAGGERRQVWAPVMRSLAPLGYRCIAIDQRGHGESGGSPADPFDSFVSDGYQVMRRIEGVPVLVGASLGGFVALVIAASGAFDIAGLVLVDVVPDPDPAAVRAYLTAVVDRHPQMSRVASSARVEDMLSRADEFRDCARALTVPVMLVTGADSTINRAAEIGRFLGLVPHAHHRVVADAGHLVAQDNPDGLLTALAEFLSGEDDRHAVPAADR